MFRLLPSRKRKVQETDRFSKEVDFIVPRKVSSMWADDYTPVMLQIYCVKPVN